MNHAEAKMRPLSAAVLLDVWERGQRLPPGRQALLLLEAASTGEPLEAPARLSVGERDARLLTLRSWTFGDRLDGSIACPACGEVLEIDVPVEALRSIPPPTGSEALELEEDGYRVRFRLPTGDDLVAVLSAAGAGSGELFARCISSAEWRGEPVSPAELPEAVVSAVGARMEAADPQSRITLSLGCELCGHAWDTPFDIVTFFWAEIERWAERMIRDVHALAFTYGWAEADILEMSASRRSAYLDLIRG